MITNSTVENVEQGTSLQRWWKMIWAMTMYLHSYEVAWFSTALGWNNQHVTLPPFMCNKVFLIWLLKKFVAHISRLLLAPFVSKLVNYTRHCESLNNPEQSEEFQNRRYFPWKTANCRFSNILQRLTVPLIIDQFHCKRCQKKRKDVDYDLL